MNYSKNPEGIIAACKILKERGFDFEVLMIGNKEEGVLSLAINLDWGTCCFSKLPFLTMK
jgi:hypothetical protein